MSLEYRIKRIVSDAINIRPVILSNNLPLVNFGLSRLDILYLREVLEDEFNLLITDDNLSKLLTMKDIVNFVKSKFRKRYKDIR